jgi:type VI secretion system protein ImpG
MSDLLLPYYERELRLLRDAGAALRRQNPKLAGRLELGAEGSADPHVERLLQGFALVAARLQQRLDQGGGDIAEALLEQLFPHLLRPVPVRGIIRMEPGAGTMAAAGAEERAVLVPAGTSLLAPPLRAPEAGELRGLACRFRTVFPVEVAPIQVQEAELRAMQPGSPRAMTELADARLRLRLTCPARGGFAALGLTRLRLHLQGDTQTAMTLYELVMGRACVAAGIRRGGAPEGAEWRTTARPIQIAPVGFEPEEALLQGVPDSLHGYRLLLEYFTFPEKFLFFDIVGLDAALDGLGDDIEIGIELRSGDRRRGIDLLGRDVGPGSFGLNCVPAVNLFSVDAEPIRLTHEASEHPVVVDQRRPLGFEVQLVEAVALVGRRGRLGRRELAPLHARHRLGLGLPGIDPPAGVEEIYYSASRQASPDGAEWVSLSVIDKTLSPATPTDGVLLPRVLASNRDAPRWLPAEGDGAAFAIDGQATLVGRRLGRIAPPVRLAKGAAARWRLVSHLAANRRSLVADGPAALRQLLSVYNLAEAGGDPQLGLEIERQIEAVTDVAARGVTLPIGDPLRRAIVTGTEVELTLDESRLLPGTAFLFSAVLDRFLAAYASANSFTRLRVLSSQRAEPLVEWTPRIGLRPLL